MALLKEGSPLFVHLRGFAAQFTQVLVDAGFYDPQREGPDIEKIKGLVAPYLDKGQNTKLPDEKLAWAIQFAASTGAAFQALGSWDIAYLWYQIGQYGWRGKAGWYEGDLAALSALEREGLAEGQEGPGICAALADNTPRAEQLFRWIASSRAKTNAELQEEEQKHYYQSIWQSLGFQLFAMMWLGDQWTEVRRLAEIGRRVIEKTRKAGHPKDFREPQLLIEISWQLSPYFLDPTKQTKEMAINALRLDKLPDRDTHTRFGMLMYLFTLAHRYPEISPYPDSVFNMRLWHPSMEKRDSPPTKEEFQAACNEVFAQAEREKKYYVRVSSTDLHLRVGGYPSSSHRLKLCCEVMRKNMKGRDRIIGQSSPPEESWLEIIYNIPRPR